jgi:hypothetical protein
MFCVLGLPWQAANESIFEEENNIGALIGPKRLKK